MPPSRLRRLILLFVLTALALLACRLSDRQGTPTSGGVSVTFLHEKGARAGYGRSWRRRVRSGDRPEPEGTQRLWDNGEQLSYTRSTATAARV